MAISHASISCSTTDATDIIDITSKVAAFVTSSGISNGHMLVFVPGSTASVTTIEYESGVVDDLRKAIEALVPHGKRYAHDARWGDGNGFAHVRAALLKPQITVPVIDGKPALGTWQQIVLLDFDNRPRKRTILLSISGD